MAAIVRGCTRQPLLTVLLALALSAAAIAYTVHALGFVTSNVRLLPQGERYVVLLKEYQRDFGELNDIVVVVETPRPDDSKAFASRLVSELEKEGVSPSRITYRVDRSYFDGRALLYVPVDDLTKLRDQLFDRQEFIEGYAAHPTLARLVEGLNRQIAGAMLLGFFDLGLQSQQTTDLRFLEAVIDQISASLDGTSTYTSPWATAFSEGRLDDPDAGYYFSADRQWLFLFVTQRREEGNFADSRGTIETIRRSIANLRREFPGVEAGVTGGPTISNDEMVTAFDDSKVATVLAFALTLGLLVAGFRRVVKPLLMLTTLAVSLGWSLGLITLVIGHLSIFSVMFISIVVGIGTDYGIYFLYRYQEELSLGPTAAAALRRAAERAGPGIFLGTVTAAGAFFVLVLTDFQGIREFGLVAGIAILMAALSMITLFPAVLALVDRRGPGRTPRDAGQIASATWLRPVVRHRKMILAAALGLTAFAVASAVHVDFDYNMLKLQARGVESVTWEERILTKAGRSGFAALATASSLDELRRKQDAVAALPSVAKVESVLMLMPGDQAAKMKLIHQMAPVVPPVEVTPVAAVQPAELRGALETLRRRLALAIGDGGDKARHEIGPVQTKLEALIGKLARPDERRAVPALAQLQERVAADFAEKLRSLRKNLAPEPIEPGDAPPELRRRFIGTSGRYLLRIHPAVDIWQQAGAERFVTDLRREDPDVTGPPITAFEAIRFIRHGYFHGTLYALVLVTVVTAAVLRSVRSTVLALAPLALGVLWTLGFMPVFGLEFNLANVWALPLIIGTAAEFGLNIFVRVEQGRRSGGPLLAQSTVMAVVLNGFTTMAGFASLMAAHHQGIFGLGLLLTIGMIASLIASLAVLPALLRTWYGAVLSEGSPTSDAIASAAPR